MGPPFPGKWTFKYHPWLRDMHDSKSEINVGQKGAQLGFSETMLNIVFFKIDVEGVDCLYVLPAKTPDASEFSAARFDPALDLSPHLSNLFSEVKNVGHKRAGTTNLYIRGSKSRAGLKAVPVGTLILDEVDEFNQQNIPLALERLSGQRKRLAWMVSNPKIESQGINKYYEQSTKESFYFRCPHCSQFTTLIFPQSLELTAQSVDDQDIIHSYIKCKECNGKLDWQSKHEWLQNGKWIAEHPLRDIRGFYINQLYASTVAGNPVDIARAYLRSLHDFTDEQTFWNNKMGLPHTVEGAKITDLMLEACKGGFLNGESIPQGLVTMGVDVGKDLHYEIDEWHLGQNVVDLSTDANVKVLKQGKVKSFDELDNLMYEWKPLAAVIDANPERRKAYEFSTRFYGHVKMCFYGVGIHGKQIHESKTVTTNEPTITVDRTSWLDLSLGRFRQKSISIPQNIDFEYRDHLKCLTRSYERDKDGNPIGKYIKGSGDDHYAHARNYAEIALPFAMHMASPQSIRNPVI